MLKLTILILGTLISFSSMASTHGGGVLMKNAMMRAGNGSGTMDALLGSGGGGAVLNSTNSGETIATKEIIFNMGQKDGFVKFAYGQLVDQQWQIQQLVISEEQVFKDNNLLEALLDSASRNEWIKLKED